MLELGVTPDRLSYGNTIKKAQHIRYAYERGVRLYTSDCEADIRNLAREAPGSRVFFRLLMDAVTSDSDWPLSRKFGCQPRTVSYTHLDVYKRQPTSSPTAGRPSSSPTPNTPRPSRDWRP